jgi:hypothetical protein
VTAWWETPLGELRFHWGQAYEIHFRHGRFTAVRRDDGSAISRDDPGELLEEIRRDYSARPVPRDGS